MKSRGLRLFICGQISLYLFLALCIYLKPGYLRDDGGLSNYGVHWPTVVFYSLAFGLAAGFTYLSSFFLKPNQTLKQTLTIYAVLLALLLLSTYPYKHSHLFRDIHILAGSLLFLYQSAVSVRLYLKRKKNYLIGVLAILQITAVIIGGLSLFNIFGLLLISQLLSALSFGLLVIISWQNPSN